MTDDSIIDEIHRFREEFADRHQHDMEAMMLSVKQFSTSIITDGEGRFIGLRTQDLTVPNPNSRVATSVS